MSLNTPFLGKACLVVAKDDFLSGLIVTSLHQIGFADVQTAGDVADAVQLVSSTAYDVIVCAGKTTDEPLHMVRCIRMETPEGAAVGAIIGITGHMDVSDLAAMRNSGANCIVTLPINTRSMLKKRQSGAGRPSGDDLECDLSGALSAELRAPYLQWGAPSCHRPGSAGPVSIGLLPFRWDCGLARKEWRAFLRLCGFSLEAAWAFAPQGGARE